MKNKEALMKKLWYIFVGIEFAILYSVLGILSFVLIIPIFFKAYYAFFNALKLIFNPFDKEVTLDFFDAPIRNTVWLIYGGFLLSLLAFITGLLLYCTIFLAPLGKQQLKIAKFSLAPHSAMVY